MVDAVTITNGKAEMAYVGDVPWHGMGKNLIPGQTIETWQDAAGMLWNVKASPVQYSDADGNLRNWNERVTLFRSDNSNPLGVVSDKYEIVQPREVLEFFRDLTEAAGFQLETAGTLFGGSRFWALASTGASAAVLDAADRMKSYLLLSTSADGSLASEGRYTNVRVVCNNTLSAARKGKASVRVTHRSKFDEKAVKAQLGIEQAHDQFESSMDEFRRMAETRIDGGDVLLATAKLFVPKWDDMKTDDKKAYLRRDNTPVAKAAMRTLNGTGIGAKLDGAGDTVWGWLNAVTEFVDHEGTARTPDRRLDSAWYGKGNATKDRAVEMAMEMVTASGEVRTVYRSAPVPARSPDPEAEAGASVLEDILSGV